MGMAASQARLLTITARIHDVEFEAQSIQNAKLQLAVQEDKIYKDYLEALDATTLTVKDYSGNRIAATFNSLCGENRVESLYTYALKNATTGLLIVPDKIAEAYEKYASSNSAFDFALEVLGLGNNSSNSNNALGQVLINHKDQTKSKQYQDMTDILKQIDDLLSADNGFYKNDNTCQRLFVNDEPNFGTKGDNNAQTQIGWTLNQAENYFNKTEGIPSSTKNKFLSLVNELKEKAFKYYPDELLKNYDPNNITTSDKAKYVSSQMNYYIGMYNQIQASGGCIPISDYQDPLGGSIENNSEWLKTMVESGKITVHVVQNELDSNNIEFKGTGIGSDSLLESVNNSDIDKTQQAKAEAEYEHKMKQIQRKDKQYDLSLSKLETERKSLTTQLEGLKKVIDDNINRTFNIFGS